MDGVCLCVVTSDAEAYTKSKGCRGEPHPDAVRLLQAVVPGVASTMEIFGCDQGSWLAASRLSSFAVLSLAPVV